jgi:hypothetical protein
MDDFPAAHSMDSTWFAVDADGHVALFFTGEAGGLPVEGYGDDDVLHEAELRALPRVGQRFEPNAGGHLGAVEDTDDFHVFAFVRDLAEVRDLIPALHATEYAATTGAALVLARPAADAFAELHRRGQCVTCTRFWGDDVDDLEQGHEGLAAHGIYIYDHTTDNWIAGPYERSRVPVRPVHVADLPDEIGEFAARFAGRWAEVRVIQPAEHWRSRAWDDVWLGTDGTRRPFPGDDGLGSPPVEPDEE